MDKYLRFESAEQAQSVLYTQVAVAWDNTDPENPVATEFESRPNFQNIDIIGTIYEPTGEMLMGEDGEYPEMAPIEGWHVNVRLAGEDPTSLEPYAVEVNSPVRIWA